MGDIINKANSVFRDDNGHYPVKSEIRDLFASVEAIAQAGDAFASAADQIGAGEGVVVYQDGKFFTEDRGDFRGNPGGTDYSPGTLAELSGMTIADGIDQVLATGITTAGDIGAAVVFLYDPSVDAAYVAAHPDTSFLDANDRGFKRVVQADAVVLQVSTNLDIAARNY